MRVLGRLRLSRSTEESTSIERQREIIEQWSLTNGHTVVGWAEDSNVSGSVDPFDTPQLGPWLHNRADQFDLIAVWKLDRLSRNSIKLNKLFAWCLDHDKTVVSCSESIDLGTPVGRLIANVIAFLAEGELEAIRERVKGSKQKLRELGRFGGGKPPFGYAVVQHPDGVGKSLEIDPLATTVVRRIVDAVLDGKPLAHIARDLNTDGYRTPAAYYTSLRAGEPSVRWSEGETPSGSWNTTPLRNMLRNKALRGFVHHNNETIRDQDGMPVQLADPLVTLDEWDLVQAVLDRTQESFSGAQRSDGNALTGVCVCIHCGAPLHHDRNTVKRKKTKTRKGAEYVYRYYRCGRREHVMIPADDLETLAEEAFLYEVGDLQMQERIWIPGDSREAELREAVTALDELTQAAGRAVSATAKQRLQRQLATLDARIAKLEAAPSREARWEYRPTGDTYRSVWEASDEEQRRELLLKSGITIAAGISGVDGKRSAANAGTFSCEIRVPDELRANLGIINREGNDR